MKQEPAEVILQKQQEKPKFTTKLVAAGAGMPGSSELSKAEWIEVKAGTNRAGSAQRTRARTLLLR